MTIADVAAHLKCSERQVRRYCVEGLHGNVLRSERDGRGRAITREDYAAWALACGFPQMPAPEPKKGALECLRIDDPAPDDPIALPENATPADLDTWASAELRAGVERWKQPDCLNGPPTNAPAFGSGSMPNPDNFALVIRAKAILLERSF